MSAPETISKASNDPNSVAVKAAFAKCYGIKDPDAQSELLTQLEKENPQLAAEVRRLLEALQTNKKIEKITAFVPNLDLSLMDAPEDLDDLYAELRATEVTNPSVLRSMERASENPPRVVLKSASEDDPVLKVNSSELENQTNSQEGRYRLDGEIARGGMGAILKGRDTDLGRDLAIKVLLKEHRKNTNAVKRFIEEAQIGGQLQHPGIAPVYELGQFKDKRPFFTMKLIKGKTLAALLSDRSSPEEGRTKFLGIFEQVCQTMAYAHSRGVLHRDLKPSNVMVGAFGEVQVMDWGLAKVVATGGIADEKKQKKESVDRSQIQTIRSVDTKTDSAAEMSSKDGSATRVGSVMGTPAYMSPEQASGNIEHLDERTDVFSLGSILCEILTGEPVYGWGKHVDLLVAAREGYNRPAFERLDDSTADRKLVQLAKDCLSIDRNRRPNDAAAVSERIREYQESVEQRLRESDLEVARTKTKAQEEIKRRRITVALAIVVVLAAGLGAAAWMWMKEKDAQLAKVRADVQLEEAAARAKREQEVRAELLLAESLVSFSDQLPNGRDVERAATALDRAQRAIADESFDSDLKVRLKEIATEIARQKSNLQLVDRLEEIWILEQQFFAEKDLLIGNRDNTEVSFPSSNQPYELGKEQINQVTESTQYSPLSNPASMYRKAFQQWGVILNEMPTGEFVNRVRALPKKSQLTVIASLNRWRLLLEADYSLTDWAAQNWIHLMPVRPEPGELEEYSILESDTVLISQGETENGSKLVFETTQAEISGLRLEALLHESLPNNGPGNGPGGMYVVSDLKVAIAPRLNPNNVVPVELVSGATDYQDNYWPFQPDYWRVGLGGGRSHTAYYRFAEGFRNQHGFRISITTKNEALSRARATTGSLGCLRWSAADLPDYKIEGSLLDAVMDQLDLDLWRKATREAMLTGNTTKLIELSSEEEAREQPSIFLAGMARSLISRTDLELGSYLFRQTKWNDVKPSLVTSQNGTDYVPSEDGTIVAAGDTPETERTTLFYSAEQIPAENPVLRIDFLKENETESDSSIGRRYWLQLREISVSQSSELSTQNIIRHAFTDASFPFPLAKLFDGDEDTAIRTPMPERPRSLFILLDPNRLNRQRPVELRIHSGGKGYNPARFRISSGAIAPRQANPIEAAGKLMRRLLVDRPTDPIVNLQLTRYYQRSIPSRTEDAIRHASITGTHLGQGLVPSLLMVDVLEPRYLLDNPPLRDLAMVHAQRIENQHPGGPHSSRLRFSIQNDVTEKYRRGKIVEAEQLIEFAISFWHDPVEFLYGVVRDTTFAQKPTASVRQSIAKMMIQFIQDNEDTLRPEIDYLRLAIALENVGESEFSSRVIQRGVQAYPDNGDFHRLFSVDLKSRGQTIEAKTEFKKALEIYNSTLSVNPDSAGALKGLGWLHHQWGQSQEAIESFSDLLKLNPDDPNAVAIRAGHYHRLGRHKLALADFSRVIELDPRNNWRYFERARVFRDMGKFENAIADIQKGFQVDPVTDAKWATRESMRLLLADILLLNINDNEGAIEQYNLILQANQSQFSALRGRAHANWQMKRYEAALRDVDRAISIRPDDSTSYSIRAHVNEEMADWGAALNDRNRVIELGGKSSRQYFLRARLHRLRGEFRLALKDINKCLEISAGPDQEFFSLAAKVLAGDIYLDDLGEPENAKVHFDQARKLNSNNAVDSSWKSWTRRIRLKNHGAAMLETGQYQVAIDIFTRALEISPGDLEVLRLRAKAYRRSGQAEQAFADADRLIQAEPSLDAAYFERAVIYRDQGKYQLAVKDIESGLEMESDREAWWFSRSRAHAVAGDIYLIYLNNPAAAIDHYESAIAMAPGNLSYQEKYEKAKLTDMQSAPEKKD